MISNMKAFLPSQLSLLEAEKMKELHFSQNQGQLQGQHSPVCLSACVNKNICVEPGNNQIAAAEPGDLREYFMKDYFSSAMLLSENSSSRSVQVLTPKNKFWFDSFIWSILSQTHILQNSTS